MSTAAIPVRVALVDQTGIDPAELETLIGALSEQLASDFNPVWKVVLA